MAVGAATLDQNVYARQVRQTRQSLDTIKDSSLVSITGLGIGEVRTLKQEISEIFPASNLPAFLLQGLLQLEDRTLKQDRITADLRVLFRGTKQIGLYGTFLAAPALVLRGYQKLLALAGKDVESAFPDGPWQFYTQFGLREDAARHCVETTGFERAAPTASDSDKLTCWAYAAMCLLFAYDDLLENEWQERMLPRLLDLLLEERAAAAVAKVLPRRAKEADRERAIDEHVAQMRQEYKLDRLISGWAAKRPYSGPPGAPLDDYAKFRRGRFRAYLDQALRALPADLRAALDQRLEERRARDLPAYQQQLTVLMTLTPEVYQDHRTPLPPYLAGVAVVAGGRYYLLDACARDDQGRLLIFPRDGAPDSVGIALTLARADDGSLRDRYNRAVEVDRRGRVHAGDDVIGRLRPPPIEHVKGQIEAILRQARAGDLPPTDLLLAQTPRARQSQLRALLDDSVQAELTMLRRALIVINWDVHDGSLPLAELRRTRRGCGDHALTLIRTDRSVVFDMSHIFFDAVWGMALAEIATGLAGALCPLVSGARPVGVKPVAPAHLAATPAFLEAAQAAGAEVPAEVAAETSAVDLRALSRLRYRMSEIELDLTVNDLLLLARCAHTASYKPGLIAQRALAAIGGLEGGPALAQQIEARVEEERGLNPALLIPMDASSADPRLRLFPTTFRNPLPELLPRLERCDALVHGLRRANEADRQTFEQERQMLYRELRTFGELLRALKQVTMRGESFTTAALRLLAHLPGPMQHLVDLIPQKISILNEIIKGREVFSNVGKVAASSSITRFASARDDGETKLLIWGVMSDAHGQMYVTLRDFRPHVAALQRLGRADLAQALAQDYLDAYAISANDLVRRIQRVMSFK